MKIKTSELKNIIREEFEKTLQEIDFSSYDDYNPADDGQMTQDGMVQDVETVIKNRIGQNSVSLLGADGNTIKFAFDIDGFRQFITDSLAKQGLNVDFVAIDEQEGQEIIEVHMKF